MCIHIQFCLLLKFNMILEILISDDIQKIQYNWSQITAVLQDTLE